ncbi:MAG: hypothetical protein WCT45_00930 [Candidatus Paceibacterota bacterium]|jgi:hypothetical protein
MAKSFSEVPPPSEEELARRAEKAKQLEAFGSVVNETIARLKDVDTKGLRTEYSNTEALNAMQKDMDALKGEEEFATDVALAGDVLAMPYVDVPSDELKLPGADTAAPLGFKLPESAAVDAPVEIPASVRNVFKSGRERKAVAAETPLPSVFHSNRRPKQESAAEARIVPNPEDAIDRQRVQEILTAARISGAETKDGWKTPAELKNELREVVGKFFGSAKEKLAMSERGEKLKSFLSERSNALAEKAKGFGSAIENFVREKGEEYNKLSFKKKLLIGAILGVGTAAFATVSTPLATALAINLGIQRFGGAASAFLKLEKHLQNTVQGESKNILGRQEWYQNLFLGSSERQRKITAALVAATYGSAFGSALGATVQFASESSAGEMVHEWLHAVLGHNVETVVPHPTPTEVAPLTAESSVERPTIGVQSDVAEVRRLENLIAQPEAAPLAATEMPPASPETMPEELGISEAPSTEAPASEAAEQLSGPTESAPEGVGEQSVQEGQAGEGIVEGQNPDIDEETRRRALESVASSDQGIPPAPTEVEAQADIEISQPTEPPQIDVIKNPETPPVSVDTSASQPDVSAEQAPVIPTEPPPMRPEYTEAFVNQNKLPIDPLQGHVFQDADGAVLSYGNDFNARFNAAQEYVKANHDAVVWVQAEKPVFYDGDWRPWVFQVKYSGWGPFGSVQAILPSGLPSLEQIGRISPDRFTEQLDK